MHLVHYIRPVDAIVSLFQHFALHKHIDNRIHTNIQMHVRPPLTFAVQMQLVFPIRRESLQKCTQFSCCSMADVCCTHANRCNCKNYIAPRCTRFRHDTERDRGIYRERDRARERAKAICIDRARKNDAIFNVTRTYLLQSVALNWIYAIKYMCMTCSNNRNRNPFHIYYTHRKSGQPYACLWYRIVFIE